MGLNVRLVVLAGNLTRDPEQRYTNSGSEVSQFGLAVNEVWTRDGEKQERVHFYDCVAYGRVAEAINEHFSKGDPIHFQGTPDYSEWEAQDGSKRSKIQMKVLTWQFVPKPNRDGNGGGTRSSRRQPQIDESEFADIPF